MTKIGLSLIGAALFTPPWLYRLTIKSTAWFWWPLAFLGADVGTRKNPKLVHFQVMGSLWAKTTILFSCASLASFLVATLLVDGAVFRGNPLLTPLGYLLVIDWSPRLWQISAIAVSVLSLALVFIVNYASGEFEIAQESGSQEELEAAERKFDLVQRVARLRFLFAVIFWVLVAAQALLYLNGRQCWFDIPSRIRNLAQTIYGSHLPEYRCQQRETEM